MENRKSKITLYDIVAVGLMAAVVFVISLINRTGSHAREAKTGDITTKGIR